MKIRDFELEVYFGKYEFTAPHLLAQSDCEPLTIADLLAFEPGAEDAMKDCWLGYTEVTGSPRLREMTADLYDNIKPEEILMHTGAQEAIFDFMNTVLEKGDHVVSMFPIYQSLYEVANSIGCEISRWELRPATGKWELDFDELEKLIRPDTRVIAVNTPNNPTGYTLTSEEIHRLCAVADKHGIYIFSDEVYRGLDLDGSQRPWMADVYDRAVSLGVLSKSYGLAGLRIGWVACRDKALLEKMTRFKHYLSICNSAPSEFLAEIALKHGETLLSRSREIIEDNLKIADAFFEKHNRLFTNRRPQCGPVAFHEIHVEQPVEAFCEKLVEKAGVLLLPSSAYEYGHSYFRLGYGRKSFAENLGILEKYLVENSYIR